MIVIGSENGGVLRSSFPSSPWDSSSVPRQIRLLGVSFSSLLAEDFLSELWLKLDLLHHMGSRLHVFVTIV